MLSPSKTFLAHVLTSAQIDLGRAEGQSLFESLKLLRAHNFCGLDVPGPRALQGGASRARSDGLSAGQRCDEAVAELRVQHAARAGQEVREHVQDRSPDRLPRCPGAYIPRPTAP